MNWPVGSGAANASRRHYATPTRRCRQRWIVRRRPPPARRCRRSGTGCTSCRCTASRRSVPTVTRSAAASCRRCRCRVACGRAASSSSTAAAHRRRDHADVDDRRRHAKRPAAPARWSSSRCGTRSARHGGADLALTEFHDIVYREAPQPGDAPPPPQAAPAEAAWERDMGAGRRAAVPLLRAHVQRPSHPLRPPLRDRGGRLSRAHRARSAASRRCCSTCFAASARTREVARFEFRAMRPMFDIHPLLRLRRAAVRRQDVPPVGRGPRRLARDGCDRSGQVKRAPGAGSMSATIIDSRIFGNIFSTAAMREVWSDENRTAKYLDIERALAMVQGGLGIIPKEAADEIARNCELSKIDMDKLRGQDRAHRLPDPRRRLADQRALQGQARRVLPLGRDDAGHHRHRDGAADPRRAGAGRAGPGGDRRCAGGAGTQVSRHADHRPQQPAAGHADHLRLQDGQHPRRHRASPRAPGSSCSRAC